MPYVTVESNRYIGEHSCGKYHYGDMSVVRDCCVEDCQKWAQLAIDKAMTTSHPAYRMYVNAWNSLTNAEMALVPNLIHSGSQGGFRALTDAERKAHLEMSDS